MIKGKLYNYAELARYGTGILIGLLILNPHFAFFSIAVVSGFIISGFRRKSIIYTAVIGIGFTGLVLVSQILNYGMGWMMNSFFFPFSYLVDLPTGNLWELNSINAWRDVSIQNYIDAITDTSVFNIYYVALIIFITFPLSGWFSYYLRKRLDSAKMYSHEFEESSNASIKSKVKKPVNYKNGFLIGNDENGKDVLLLEKNSNVHTLVLGTTGSGKTTTLSVLIEGAIDKGWPVIFVDGKGDETLGRSVTKYAESKNRSSYYFSMNKESDVYYNPLVSGDYTSKKDRIVSLFDDQNEYYRSLSEGYIQIVFKILETCGINVDLKQTWSFMPDTALINLIRNSVSNDTIDKATGEALIAELERFETATKDISSVSTHINNLISSASGQFFDTEGDNKKILELPNALSDNAVIYFKLPALKADQFVSSLGKLIINDIKATLHDRLEDGKISPVLLIFDEFSSFAGKQVITLLSQGRSTGAHCVLGTQGFADFMGGREGEKTLDQMLNNINNFVIHKIAGVKDREICASLVGSKSIKKLTQQIGGVESTHMGSMRDAHEFIIHPTEFQKIRGAGDGYFLSSDEHEERFYSRVQIRQSTIREFE